MSMSKSKQLCRQMLILGAFADGTKDMTGKEVKELLYPFFGEKLVNECLPLEPDEPERSVGELETAIREWGMDL